MIKQRRIFQAKPGEAAAVVAKMKEFQPILEKFVGSAHLSVTAQNNSVPVMMSL